MVRIPFRFSYYFPLCVVSMDVLEGYLGWQRIYEKIGSQPRIQSASTRRRVPDDKAQIGAMVLDDIETKSS